MLKGAGCGSIFATGCHRDSSLPSLNIYLPPKICRSGVHSSSGVPLAIGGHTDVSVNSREQPGDTAGQRRDEDRGVTEW